MTAKPFSSLEDTTTRLEQVGYLPDARIATSAFLAARLERPLLVEGPAGVGKTELGRAMARAQGLELIRLQCYEGIDESRALYEWEYGKQLLYTEILREKIGALVKEDETLDEAVRHLSEEGGAFFSETFLLERPLLRAVRSERPCLLLLDEIDKADPEFEAFLLEVLSDFAVSIPELGTLRAKVPPQVILTSNNSRELSDPLKRRCLHLWIPLPDKEREIAILKSHLPDLDDALARGIVGAVRKLRDLDLRKAPSISEVIDWARAIRVLAHDVVDEQVLSQTIGALLKHRDDLVLAEERRRDIAEAARKAASEDGSPQT